MKCYCISGLGADKRVFKNLSLKHSLIHIEWLEPQKKESLSEYCKRLALQFDVSEPFLILGVSFGGIVACELAKTLKPQTVILISTIINKEELPLLIKLASIVKINKAVCFIPKPPMFLTFWLFGVKNPENKSLLKQIIKDTNPIFLKWAIEKILSLEKISTPEKFIRIHGTNDKILPIKGNNFIFKIKDGGHFSIMDNANEISSILNIHT